MVATTPANSTLALRHSGGFTLVEMLMVTSVVTFLGILALPSVSTVIGGHRPQTGSADVMSQALQQREASQRAGGCVQSERAQAFMQEVLVARRESRPDLVRASHCEKR